MEYFHYKTGGRYDLVSDTAMIEATKERAVVYKCQKTGQVWIRSYGDFFALVERPENQGFTPRFTPTGR
jgi:hypothetical protein